MGTVDLSSLLSALDPTISEVTTILSTFGKLNPQFVQVLLKGLDPNVLNKIATWAYQFAKKLNDLGSESFVDPDTLIASMKDNDFNDFFSLMNGTAYTGPVLNWVTLDTALAQITTFIKGENWEQAILMGISLAKFLPA